MKCCKNMICRWHYAHEVFLHDCFMISECDRHIFEDYSFFDEFSTELVIDDLTIILCSDSCEDFSFCLRNTKPLKCSLDIFWYIIPGFPIATSLSLTKIIYTLEIKCCK